MTANVAAWFVPKFEETVKHHSQQLVSRLGDTVSGGGTFIGDKVYFPRMGAVEAYDSPAFARLILANADQDFIEVQASPKFVAFGLWDPNSAKYSIATAVEYGKSAAAAIRRAEDRVIIEALRTAAAVGVPAIGGANPVPITTIGDYNTVASMDDVAEAVAILGSNEAFEGEDVTIVTPFRNKVQFALDPLMNSNQVKNNLPWNDLNWRRSQQLPMDAGAGGVDLFVYARSSVVSAYNDEMTKIDERDGPSLTDIKGYYVQVGARARAGEGIVRIKSKANFTLDRYPVKTQEVAP
ncbi:hypothetical protein D3C71_665390 [compost metagenome]